MAEELAVKHDIVVAPEQPAPESVAEIEAAAAAASAQTAREAAAAAIAESEIAAAGVATVAATEMAGYQERLAQCELSLQTAIQSQEESSARFAQLEASQAETLEHLSSIRSRLEASPGPDPASRSAEPPSENQEETSTSPQTVAPEEPEKPERRRAHRWI
jgi:hypothetical protein